jgi:hypothetical protein
METAQFEDIVPFIFNTSILLVGSWLLTSGMHFGGSPWALAVFPLFYMELIGGILVSESVLLGLVWCYVFYQKTTQRDESGGYLCPRCQSYCHPDASRCWFCSRDLNLPLDTNLHTTKQHFTASTEANICCICGCTGNYYRNGHWFCFQHRELGR